MKTLREFKITETTEIDVMNEIAYEDLDCLVVTVEGDGMVEVYQKMACEASYQIVTGMNIKAFTCDDQLLAGQYVLPLANPDFLKIAVSGCTACIKMCEGSYSTHIPFTNNQPTVSSLTVTTNPTKTTYFEGEHLDLTGAKITATLSDNKTANVTKLCSYLPADNAVLTTNDTSVTVSYGGKTATISLTVNPLSENCAITAFSINDVSGTITEDTKSIAVELPYGSTVTALAPEITISQYATVDPESEVEQDFTNPVEYVVTAQDGTTTATYTVTVTVAS